jgi:NodT family efflux transporter outer membrane factor (OMF) lipoprotein
VGDSRALADTHLSLPSVHDGPLPLPLEGRRENYSLRCVSTICGTLVTTRQFPAIAGIVALALTACTVGPDYQRPATVVPAVYKEDPGWRKARPADALDRGAWWSVFRDPILDGLTRQVDVSNQNLKAAEAAFRQAEALVAQARAGFFPTAQINASAERSRSPGTTASNQFSLTASASWIPDLWGRVGRTVESNVASAQASAADVANARLAAQGQLATAYLQLRVADDLKRLLDASVKAFAESLRITENQYNAGIAAASDVAQARTQLESTRAQAIAVGVSRAQFEHAIAVLIGKPPAELTIATVTTVPPLPTRRSCRRHCSNVAPTSPPPSA